jgi:hypothetical protein
LIVKISKRNPPVILSSVEFCAIKIFSSMFEFSPFFVNEVKYT